jgi:small ligand-binding sensory domain FIST
MTAAIPCVPGPFRVAHGKGDHWGMAAKACLDRLGPVPEGANFGFLYATEAFAPNLSSILTFLRETTRIEHWVGGVAPGLCVEGEEIRDGGAVAAMVGHLPPGQFRVFIGDADDWSKRHFPCVGLVHGDPRDPEVPQAIVDLAAQSGFLVGGLMSAAGPAAQLAGITTDGGLAGVLLGSGIEVLTGMSQGCSPLGTIHTVTESWQGVVMALDGRPALDVLKKEVGELLARDLRRIAGYIHVGLPVEGDDSHDYQVRTLIGIDPTQGWIAIGDHVEEGDTLMFVRRDANAARTDLKRMLTSLKERLGGRPIQAGLYVSCTGRGEHMFGHKGAEPELLHEVLGDFPLIGFFANGEISRDHLYGFTGVLVLLPGAYTGEPLP